MTGGAVMFPRLLSGSVLFASLALFVAPCGGYSAGTDSTDFPPELFPGLKDKSDEEVRLAGVAALYPGRLLRREPGAPVRTVPELRKTRAAELHRGGAYVRLYSPDVAAVRERVGKGPLVVDCRYLATSPGQWRACFELGEALAPEGPFSVAWRGVYAEGKPEVLRFPGASSASKRPPVVVLVNARTSGPIEAVLAATQSAGGVFLVGGRTAGETGAYKPLDGHPGWWALSGEILPSGGPSLVGVGVEPAFPVKVSPEDEFLGWQLVERGAAPGDVLRREIPGKPDGEPADPALQRACDVLAALQVLGGSPVSVKR